VLVAAVAPLAFAATRLRAAAPSAGVSAAAGVVSVAAAPAVAVALLVAAGLLFVLALDVVRLRRVKRGALPLGTVAVRRARIGTSPTVSTPTAIGYLHPAVVLPEGFRDRVDAHEWDAVLAHECAHLARRDDWAKAFQSALLRAGWWMPGLWILSRALDLERELASDERAVGAGGARRYAACLLRLATARGTDAVAPGLWGRRSHVAIRVERLLRPVPGGAPVVRAAALGAFSALALAVVAAAVVVVPGTGPQPVVAEVQPTPVRAVVIAHATVHRQIRPSAHLRRPAPPRVISFVGPSAVAAPAQRFPAATRVTVRTGVPVESPSKTKPKQPTALAWAPPRPAAASAPRRPPDRRPAAIRADVSPEALAYVAATAPRRCATCFGPLRSPDVAVPSPAPAFAAPSASGTGASAIAVGDPGAGAVDLNPGLIWYRVPARIIQLP
jgi:beta-lactamase regulating signal transducer with metallopeptidase domain